ncbi:hypothetical protein BHM03_00017163 [Ensete ventricosum]|nr:hypothetical protein BHM03_00017163 [Ensete ventricosum]
MKRSADEPAHTHKKQKMLASRKHKSHHGEGSLRVRSLEGKGMTRPVREHAPIEIQHPKSVQELCQASLWDKGEGYHALRMIDVPDMDLGAPLQPH